MALILFTLVVVGVSVVAVWLLLTNRRNRRDRREIESRNVKYVPQPNLMMTILRKVPLHLLTEEVIRTHGSVYGYSMLGTYNVMIGEPELIQTVLSKEFTNFTNRRVSR